MELLKTEAKYLQDLRILVNVCATLYKLGTCTNSSLQVYLQQLHHAVTSRSVASYFGTSASSSKQTPSPSPSTFNSTPAQGPTQGQPTNCTPSPVHSPSTVHRRSIGAADRAEIEKELSFTRPTFTEEDMQLLCRNSSEILAFHERFVDDLKEALAPLGSKFRFDTEDEYAYVDMPRHDTLELATQIIVSMFVDRVSFQSMLLHFIIVVIPLISHHELTSYRPDLRPNLSSFINRSARRIPRPSSWFNVRGGCLPPIGKLGRNGVGSVCSTIIDVIRCRFPAPAPRFSLGWMAIRAPVLWEARWRGVRR